MPVSSSVKKIVSYSMNGGQIPSTGSILSVRGSSAERQSSKLNQAGAAPVERSIIDV